MKISLNWLRTLLDTAHTTDQISALLTGCGLEVEGSEKYETVPGGLSGLVVGEVLTCAKHPGADRLSITTVDTGSGTPLSIVCGAPNVAAGQKVIVAPPGTKLFPINGDPFEIKRSKIRGEISEGMICAEDEIGIGNSHDGILVLPPETKTGTPAAKVFKIESDEILEIGLTPNRGDAASHYGVARDLAAVLNTAEHVSTFHAKLPPLSELPEGAEPGPVKVQVLDNAGCPRYSGLAITGIKVGESPAWIRTRLRSIGIRPINNIVDITNYVLHELGQPLHAFDIEKIKGAKIIVRRAAANEKFTTLDGIARELNENDLVICDDKDPLCIAGVFGGAESGVTANTTGVFLESAYFNASSVRGSARRHGLKTDASFRFERGADPEMTIAALRRAADLIIEIAGGKIAGEIVDVYPEKLAPYKVAFSFRNCSELIGKELDRNTVKNIILNLGMEIDSEGADGLLLFVPRYKHDVTREADVIEDVLRIHGYDHIEPSKRVKYGLPAINADQQKDTEEKVARLLAANGYHEFMGLSLNPSSYYENQDELVKVLNPLSNDLNVLRAGMLFGGLEAIAHNINRRQDRLRLFEFGKVYSKNGGADYSEKKQLSLFATGSLFRENPYGLSRDTDFSFIKSTLDAIFTSCGIGRIKTSDQVPAHYAYGLVYQNGKNTLAEAGLVNQQILKRFDIRQPVFYSVINWEELARLSALEKITFSEPGKFPSVRRDLALLIDQSVKYGDIEALAFSTERKLLSEVNLFDVYQDEKLGNRKSYAVSFTLMDKESTLTDRQIEAVMQKLIKSYREKLGAELR